MLSLASHRLLCICRRGTSRATTRPCWASHPCCSVATSLYLFVRWGHLSCSLIRERRPRCVKVTFTVMAICRRLSSDQVEVLPEMTTRSAPTPAGRWDIRSRESSSHRGPGEPPRRFTCRSKEHHFGVSSTNPSTVPQYEPKLRRSISILSFIFLCS